MVTNIHTTGGHQILLWRERGGGREGRGGRGEREGEREKGREGGRERERERETGRERERERREK